MSPKTEYEAEQQYRAQQARLFDKPQATQREIESHLLAGVLYFWGLT
jgi:hypothetical protein